MNEKLFALSDAIDALDIASDKANAICQSLCEALGENAPAKVCLDVNQAYNLSEAVSDYLYAMRDQIAVLIQTRRELQQMQAALDAESGVQA